MLEVIKTNKYQTKVTLDLIDSLPKEVADLLIDFLNNIEFITRLISPNRKTAKELPRDTEGKIIVDIVNPHILEDMNYFREAALYYLKYKVYTRLRPNKNPHSEYGKWIRRERDRIWNGMIRESDGEWITGEMYYYLNYFPIRLNVISKKHKKSVDRIVDFPQVWEGIYLWYHYIYLARYGGLYNDWEGGDHAVLIAKRGASKAHPYDQKVITSEGTKLWEEITIGSKLYDNNGNETTVTNIPYEGVDSIYRFTLKDGRQVESSKDHLWLVYRKGKLIVTDTKSIFKDFRSKRKVSDRNPKGEEFIYLIPKHGGIEYNYSPTNIDPYTLGLLIGDGTFRHPNFTNVVYLTSGAEDFEYYNNLIPYNINKLSDGFTYSINIEGVTLYLRDYGLHMTKSEGKFIPASYKYNSKIIRLALLRGLLDADGYVDNKGIPTLTTVSERLASDVLELIRSLGYNGKIFKNKAGYKKEGIYIETLPAYTIRIYTDDLIFGLERKNIKIKKRTSKYSRSKLDRTTIVNVEYIGEKNCKCVSVNNKEGLYLIGDHIVTHNSYSGGAILARLFVLGDSKESKENTVGVVTAYDKEKLKKDGILNKFEFGINFIALNMQFPSARLNNSLNEMYWVMGYKDPETDIKKGTLNEVMGVTSKDNADKSRGKRALKFIYEEFGAFPKFLDTWSVNKRSVLEGSYSFGTAIAFGCVCEGTEVYDKLGSPYLIENITLDKGILGYKNNKANIEPVTYILPYAEKESVEITHSYGKLSCSIDHPIYCKVPVRSRKTNSKWFVNKWVEASNIKRSYLIAEIDKIDIWGNDLIFDPYLVGALIGDGSYGIDKTPVLSNADEYLLNYVHSNYNTVIESSRKTKDNRDYLEVRIKDITLSLRLIGIYGQTKTNKRLPVNYSTLNKENVVKLLAGLFDTDGYIGPDRITLVQASEELLKLVLLLLRKLGVLSNIHKVKSSKFSTNIDRTSDKFIYVLSIRDKRSLYNFANNITLKIKYKLEAVEKLFYKYYYEDIDNIRWRKVKGIKPLGVKRIYNLTADDSNTYIANHLITHNTGGTEGSNFYGALEMIYNPIGYDVYGVPNIYDKGANGNSKSVFFFGAYLNRLGFYNENGVSDVVGALIEILMDRYKVKYNSTDPTLLTRVIAEDPITILEAIMKRDSNAYPVADLTEVRNKLIFNDHSLDNIYVGKFIMKNGEVSYSPDNTLTPIRIFPLKDNKSEGAIEIHSMPITDSSGKVTWGRYIGGIDTYDDDLSETLSLGSIYILDLMTDLIVFEYTGRPLRAEDFYEICRRALLFYNAEANYENNKKGLYGYFSKMNSLYLLSDILDFLKDKDPVKLSYTGNKSKGTTATLPVKNYGRSLLRDYLLKPIPIITTIKVDNEDVEIEDTAFNLINLRSIALIDELILWNADNNFDRHDAMVMLMLLREERLRKFQGDSTQFVQLDSSYLGNDDFFSKNYDNKRKSFDDFTKWELLIYGSYLEN